MGVALFRGSAHCCEIRADNYFVTCWYAKGSLHPHRVTGSVDSYNRGR